jgi:predicted dehydrogenase
MHAFGYAAAIKRHPNAELAGVWDCDSARLSKFSLQAGVKPAGSAEELFAVCDAVIVCSANKSHVEDVTLAAKAGKAVLCEKPLVTTEQEASEMRRVVSENGILVMTAFPCRYAPAYTRARERVRNGDIGAIKAICATNRGRCPFDWFVDTAQSGGGAMIDHTVHVADLFRDLLGEEPSSVVAQIGSNMHGQDWEDTAMLTLEFPSGVFASLDSSWSRPQSYKTWGDVTMNIVGEKGVIELDLFNQEVQVYTDRHSVAGYGSDLDDMLVSEFLDCVKTGRQPQTDLEAGLAASAVAIAGYESLKALSV